VSASQKTSDGEVETESESESESERTSSGTDGTRSACLNTRIMKSFILRLKELTPSPSAPLTLTCLLFISRVALTDRRCEHRLPISGEKRINFPRERERQRENERGGGEVR
jgi:hypothetical protein